jgi:outer membrane protein OmpA-like peptidoglycan-associated protein
MLCCAFVDAQSVVSGIVRNASDKTAVPKCAVILKGNDGSLVQTKTDSLGTYHLKLKANTEYDVYTSTDKYTTTPTAKLGFLASDDHYILQTNDTNKVFTKNFELTKVWGCGPMAPPIIFTKNNSNPITQYGYTDEYTDSSYYEHEIIIKNLSVILNKNPSIVIELSAHCSIDEKNVTILSKQRAEKVKSELVKLGINEKRIVTVGYGTRKQKIRIEQINKEKTKEGKEALHSINRRCVFKIISWEFDDGTPKKVNTPDVKIKVFGTVTSAKDNSNVPNCTVILKMDNSDSLIKKTDSIGYYSFDFVNPKFKQGQLSLIDTEKARTKTAFEGFFNSEDKGTFVLESPLVSMNYMKDFMLTPRLIDRYYPILLFKKQSIILDTNFYNYIDGNDSSDYYPQNALSMYITSLKNEPNTIIEIIGHCSSNEKNTEELSLKRAKKIKEELVKSGINEKRLICKGYGDTKQRVTDEEIKNAKNKKEKEVLHSKNRRCIFRIISWDFKE